MVDLSDQTQLGGSRARLGSSGLALPTALGALLATGVLVTGLWLIVDLSSKAAENRESSVRALQIAEAGVAHAHALLRGALEDTTLNRLLRGSDNASNTADDGGLYGYGLPSADVIPIAGRAMTGGSYFVELVDDPADGDTDPFNDTNFRILLRCTGWTSDSAMARIEVVIGVTPLPGIVTDGILTISGDPEITGPCGSAHANQILVVSGNPVVQNGVTAADTVQVSGSITDPNNQPVEPLHHQPPIVVPDVNTADYCDEADFILQANGFILDVSTTTLHDGTIGWGGWKRQSSNPVIWEDDGNTIANGTYCVEGNAKISGAHGSPGSPLQISIIATGSIEISGNPYLTPDHPSGALLVAAGDVSVSGNPVGGADNYQGVIHAGAQCKLDGNPSLNGHVVCNDGANPTGSVDYADMNLISGTPKITFDCSDIFGGTRRALSWFQSFNW